MHRREFFERAGLASTLLVGFTGTLSKVSAIARAEENDYQVSGTFVIGCACHIVCPCAFNPEEFAPGCDTIGVFALTSGTCRGADLTGVKLALAGVAGQWIHIFVDAREPQREAATALARKLFEDFGKAESFKNAGIDLTLKDGRYYLAVDKGKTAELTTEPVLGADQKTPITHVNSFDTWGRPALLQGKTLKGAYRVGEHPFTLAGGNSFFNDRVSLSGKL